MVNIALCGDILGADQEPQEIIARCASDQGLPEPALHVYSNAFELLGHLDDPQAEPLLDLIIIRAVSAGMSGLQVAHDARKSGYQGEIMLVEDSAAGALEARRLDVESYLVFPPDAADFERETSAALARLAALDADSTTLRMRGGTYRVPFSQLVYAQTSNHDQVLHLANGDTLQLRSSSQDLFDRLSHDPRFLKMGSSYIVNLDFVRSLDSSGARLSFVEGSSASVPVRFRKVVQDALFARAEWRKHA